MTNTIDTIADAVVTDLVTSSAIGHMTGDQFVLNKPVWGYQGDLALGSQDNAIKTLKPLFVSKYQQRFSGLQAAS